MNIKSLIKRTKEGVKEKSPEILLGLGIAGMAGSVIFAVKATPKALELIDDETAKKGDVLTGTEIIKTTWKCYIPALGMFVVSSVSLICGNRIKTEQQVILYSALKTSETLAESYRNKVVEKIGEKKEKEIRTDISKDLDGTSEENEQKTFDGNTVYSMRDDFTGMRLEVTPNQVDRAMIDLNCLLLKKGFVSINDFYHILGVESWPKGDTYGWNRERCVDKTGYLPNADPIATFDDRKNMHVDLVYTEDPYDMYDVSYM